MTCSVADCDRQVLARGWCNKHYLRWYRTGSLGTDTTKAPNGAGYRSKSGYVSVVRRDHPLAGYGGKVSLHRVTLYDSIGPGSHPCHWCGHVVVWKVGARDTGALVVDHLDFDRANNDPVNLVPSCAPCNARRLERRHVNHRRDARGRWVA